MLGLMKWIREGVRTWAKVAAGRSAKTSKLAVVELSDRPDGESFMAGVAGVTCTAIQ